MAALASSEAPLSDGAAPSVAPELEPEEPLDPPELEELDPLDPDPPELELLELELPPKSPPRPPSRPPRPPSPDDSPPPPLDEPPEDEPLVPEQALLWQVPPVVVQSTQDPPADPQAVSAVPGWQLPVESQQPDAQEAEHADMLPPELDPVLVLVSAPASLPAASSPLLR